MQILQRIPSLPTSILIHALIVVLVVIPWGSLTKKNEVVPFEVYVDPVKAISAPQIPQAAAKEPEAPSPPVIKKVFGLNRKSITDSSSGVSAKIGNTVAKEVDQLKLEKDDPDALPIPVADYLITDEPQVIYEPPNKQRTDEARKNGYTAVAQLKILIDIEGIVRDVKLLNALKFGLGEKAIELAKQVRLKPAMINGKPVAVIRDFTISFKATD